MNRYPERRIPARACRSKPKRRKEVRNLFIFAEQILLKQIKANPRESRVRVKHNRRALFVLSGELLSGSLRNSRGKLIFGLKAGKPLRGSTFSSRSN